MNSVTLIWSEAAGFEVYLGDSETVFFSAPTLAEVCAWLEANVY